MNDDEIRAALKALDARDDVELSSWEAWFLESLLHAYTGKLTPKQREIAIELIETHKAEKSGEQEVIRKLPPGTERYFRKP